MVFSATQEVERSGAAPPDFREWKSRTRAFERMGAFYFTNFNLSGDDDPERLLGAFVSADLFPLIGIQPLRGRHFAAQEEQWGHHRVLALSHALWQRRFGADPNIVGRTLRLNGELYEVIAVLPPGAWFGGARLELWVPLAFAPNDVMNTRNNHFLNVAARLKPTVSLEQAAADMKRIARELANEYPENAGWDATVVTFREVVMGNTELTLLLLLGAVGFVLLIACVNVANLLLARNAAREREMAIRSALGAGRRRLVRQLLTESLVMAILGGGIGLLIALWGTEMIETVIPPGIPRIHELGIEINQRVLAFTGGVSLLTAVLFGLIPALRSSRSHLSEALKEGSRSSTGGLRRRRVPNLLVVSEVALAVILLIGAGLLIKSFLRLQGVNPGFDPKNVLTTFISLPETKYPETEQKLAFFRQVLERLEKLPGVKAAGISTHLPVAGGGWGKSLSIEGRSQPSKLEDVPIVQFRQISPDYFRAIGIRLLKGRYFGDEDHSRSGGVAIVNEALVRRFFSKQEPVGARIWMFPPEQLIPANLFEQAPPGLLSPEGRFPRIMIVGVVSDVRFRGLDQAEEPTVYEPYFQGHSDSPWGSVGLVLRTASDPLRLATALREQVSAVNKDQPVHSMLTMEQRLATSLDRPRFATLLLAIFAILALSLAAVGVYGVISHAVAQRTHEIGLRIALGAQRRGVFWLVVGHASLMALIGLAIGLAAAYALTGLMFGLLYQVSTTDATTFTGVSLFLLGVTLLASYLPARRATRIDPMVTLKYE